MKEKFKNLVELIEVYNKTAMFILGFITLILTILAYIFGGIIGGILVGIILIYLFSHYFFGEKISDFYNSKLKEKIYKFGKFKTLGIIGFLFLAILSSSIYSFYSTESKIFELTKGFNLKFEQKFNGEDFLTKNSFPWIYDELDNKLTTSENGSKTLMSYAELQRGYAMFQDLRKLEGERILVGKFNLNKPGKIGIRFVNTDGFTSEKIKRFHNNECIIQLYGDNGIHTGYGHHITKNNFLPNDSIFTDRNLTNGIYYILAKISGRKFSCYYQKEGEKIVHEVITNKDIIFENLGGPVIAKYIEDPKTYPEILEFKLYTN